jgi:hypothetical protein
MNSDRKRISSASVPKPGDADGDNEDRVSHRGARIALSDGASRSARAEVWADLLVTCFVHDVCDPLDLKYLAPLREQWRTLVTEARLPWYATAKLAEGAAATFLGVELDTPACHYRAQAVGDSCLIHMLHDGEIRVAGPIDRPADFSPYPVLISTLPETDDFSDRIWTFETDYRAGDALILATDAAAAFLLDAPAQVRQELVYTDVLDDPVEYASWVEYARDCGMASDDTTICVVRL